MTEPNTHSLAVHGQHHTLRHARRLASFGLGLLLVAGGLRLGLNYRDALALQARTAESLQRTVLAVHARPGELKRNLALPATLRGSSETVVYARSAGYLTAWHKTIGDRVKKGELLATIDAPEQDQELAQARATAEQIKVRLGLARQTLERWERLRLLDSVSSQDLEEKRAARAQAEADLAAAAANVKRLEQLQAFRRIVAPFDGVITRRSVDVGALISAGGKELFAMTQTDPLRLTVWVPQAYAGDIKEGQEVSVRVNELPGKRFSASIENVAGALDPVTRSRQVDVVLPNGDGKLLPGTYVEVGLNLAGGVNTLVVPAGVVVTGPDGQRIVTVDAEKRLVFRQVKLGRDLGREVEVLSGISAEDTLVINPSDLLVEGEAVTVREMAAKGAEKGKGGQGKS